MKNTTGSRIKKRRKALGLTQEKLAEMMNTTKGTISFYENDNVDIKLSVLRELAAVLETTVGYLAEGDEPLKEVDYEIVDIIRNIKNESIRNVALEQLKLLGNIV